MEFLEERPNPDKLLQAVQVDEISTHKGALKIFLGMAAGVGKTYSMLEAAQRLQRTGIDLAIGTIDTHSRKETAALLQGLKVIPPLQISYKGALFSELNLDEILRVKPALVLVDELAHSNVPGSKHVKRWQNVIEILNNGIDVYTTLNVQHIESLKDFVESITGISIRETVPDSIIETATSIELVDITPEELLDRLKQGKVYLGNKSAIAARNFFQKDRLMALREILMRYAAEKIDHDLHCMISTAARPIGWKHREKLLAALSYTPHSQMLIRTTRRLAFNLNAPWIALHVNDGFALNPEEEKILAKNLSIATDLGAEVITVNDPDVAAAIKRTCRQQGVTQIVIGQENMGFSFASLFRRTLLDRLTYNCSEFDLHIVRKPLPSQKGRSSGAKTIFSLFILLFAIVLISVWQSSV
jgi:two-component system, OmpR family, sensor histidine kinase KdpD